MERTDTLLAKLADIATQRAALASELLDPVILADHTRIRDISIRKAALDPVADAYACYQSLAAERNELTEAMDSEDPELAAMAKAELPAVEQRMRETLDDAVKRLVTADDNAISSIILEIRAGVGGDEAGLWAADLLRMYERFAAARSWKIETLDSSIDEGLGGLRWTILNVRGDGVWTSLHHEAGTHCVKRVPATESQGRIHTSTATVAVLPEPREVDVTVDPDDVDEHVTTAQGPGGQNVNKVATAVHLIHRPTGIEVRMQETKSQQQNREKAWRLLRARLYDVELQKQREAEARARNEQIGSGGRSERIRTYRWKEGIAVDHRLGDSFSLTGVMNGDLNPIIQSLQQQEIERRLAIM